MNFNQNEKLKQVDEYTMIIGVDIASNLHYARAFDWSGFELGHVFISLSMMITVAIIGLVEMISSMVCLPFIISAGDLAICSGGELLFW
jgi:hypothetical protein